MSGPSFFPITTAQLVGNYCETLTFGIYLVTCCFCARTLLFTDGPEERLRRPSEIRWFMLSVAVALFVVSMFDDIIGLVHVMAAFVWYNGSASGGASQELTNIHDWINIARSVAQIVNIQLADLVLIYRCYVVYARRWLFVVPSVILHLVGVAAALNFLLVQVLPSNSLELPTWWSLLFGATVVQNLLTTSLLVLRIWRVEHQTRVARIQTGSTPAHEMPLRKVIRVIIESGVAYTTMVLMTFIVSLCNSNLLYPVSDATLQATGITFNVLIMRCSSSRDERFTTFDSDERSLAERGQGRITLSSLRFFSSRTSAESSIDIEHVDIKISESVRTDADSECGDSEKR